MTEVVMENNETAEVEVEAPEAPLSFSDILHKLSHEKLESDIKERNSLVGTANAANGDRLTLTEQIREESTDPEIVAARNARDEAEMRLHDLVTPKVNEILENATEGIAEVEAKIKAIDETLKPGLNYYRKSYGDVFFDKLPALARLKGIRVSGAGTGGRRVRGFNLTVTLDGEITEFENFATAAKWLDVETPELQEAFFTAAGNPAKVKDAPDKVSFTVTFTEVDDDDNQIERTASVLAYRTDVDSE